ncbi:MULTISPECIES: hypothetical protein [Bifidobacterium]|uniref:Single-stranded DNA-binding protein n=2 Tax=Bifidobacterium TaxID=1678 RepID=A0A261FTG1_9BIFI|nr:MULTISPECIES: hypothetical protein [Bifidobacterium]OZG62480.1 hypothetical protein BLEM_1026 [Bifidobacterium lemurum]OZG69016.1 hypothetical protein BEUL_0422 [Bifidobacterium eulemuris]QOL31455.1 hypothetical protein BE0216_02520 [Bifidobacterium eulemuris]QOL33822.1 hypothetical protein BL8807_08560 [Bifidobacterium lemurum]
MTASPIETGVWVKGTLSRDIRTVTYEDGNEVAYMSLIVAQQAEGSLAVKAEARGMVKGYLMAAQVRQGDKLVLFGVLRSNKHGDYVAVRIACAHTSLDGAA